MIFLLCRNRVVDYGRWKAVFDSNALAGEKAGLRLIHLWRGVEEPHNVFFLFEAASIERAKEFMSAPEAAESGQAAGVIDGEYHFIEAAGGD